jgi:hypothetical protein
MTRAQTWILTSARTGEIIHIGRDASVTSDELDELSIECEGSADNTSVAGESEYWGTTESGSTWRVHVEMDC